MHTALSLGRAAIGFLLGMAIAATPAAAQTASDSYPARAVKMIVAYPPGGPLDIMARAISEQLRESVSYTHLTLPTTQRV